MSALTGAAAGLLVVGAAVVVSTTRRGRVRVLTRRRAVPLGGGDVLVTGMPVAPLRPPAWMKKRLASAGVAHDPRRVWTAWLTTAAVATAGAVTVGGPGLALVAAVAVVVVPLAGLAANRGRADRRLEDALPGALEAVARALRSGASMIQAIDEAAIATPGRLGDDLGRVSTAAHRGQSLPLALDDWGRLRNLPGVRLAVAALGLGAETGGAQARAIDAVASTLRSRLAVTAEVRALSSQARLSGLVITVAPLGFAVLAGVIDPRTAQFLLRSSLGLLCLSAGLALDGLAAWWMNRLARIRL